MCNFYFSFQQSDVSTLKQRDDYCKDHLTSWLTRERHENRLLIDWLTRRKSENRLLTVVVANSLIDWLSKQKNQLIDCHSRRLTIRQMKIKCNHRFQKKNFFINANSRSFSLIHDAHSENEMHSSSSKKKLQIDDFLLTRVFLRMIRRFSFEHSRTSTSDEDIVSTRFFYEQLTIFFNYSRISTSIFGDFI